MITVTPELLELFQARNTHSQFGEGMRWRLGETLQVRTGAELGPYAERLEARLSSAAPPEPFTPLPLTYAKMEAAGQRSS